MAGGYRRPGRRRPRRRRPPPAAFRHIILQSVSKSARPSQTRQLQHPLHEVGIDQLGRVVMRAVAAADKRGARAEGPSCHHPSQCQQNRRQPHILHHTQQHPHQSTTAPTHQSVSNKSILTHHSLPPATPAAAAALPANVGALGERVVPLDLRGPGGDAPRVLHPPQPAHPVSQSGREQPQPQQPAG